jgi:hypothetical protein
MQFEQPRMNRHPLLVTQGFPEVPVRPPRGESIGGLVAVPSRAVAKRFIFAAD